jgi:hypothetical protein
MGINRLGTWGRKEGIWRIRTDQELRELCKDLDIVAGIKKKNLEWIGRVIRMVQGRTVKKILVGKPERNGRRRRPRLR